MLRAAFPGARCSSTHPRTLLASVPQPVRPLRTAQVQERRGVAAHAGSAATPPDADGHAWHGINKRPGGRFVARIKVRGREVRLGSFGSAEEAARQYDRAAVRLGRPPEYLNFPEKDYYDGNGQLLPEPELDARLSAADSDNPAPSEPAISTTYGGKPQSSQYLGVSRHRDGYQVQIVLKRKLVFLGAFGPDEEEEAAHTYDRAALRAKERPRTNFPRECYCDANGQLLPEPRIDAILRGDPLDKDVARSGKPLRNGTPKTSGYKGVSREVRATQATARPWRAQIKHNQKSTFLGRYATEEEAARAYDKAAVSLKPHDAHLELNFQLSDYVDAQGHLLPEPDIDARLKLDQPDDME